jgi:PKD repeat protein
MVIVFMVSRLRRASARAALLFVSGVITVACQKVPLLAPTGSVITLNSSATSLPIGGTADIIAQVIEAAGTPPHEGTHVTFTTNLGTIQPSEASTDIAGRAIVKFVAGTASGTATITAISGGVSVAAANAVKIQIGAAAVGSVSASASPATLPNTGGTSTITATVSDISGNPLASVPVTFSIDTATGSSGAGSLSATVANTDANGRAQVTLTTNRTTIVAATAGIGAATGTPPSGGTQTGKVTVTVNATTSIAIGAPTPASPVVGQTVTLPLTYGTATTTSPIVRVTADWGDGQVSTYTGQIAAISHTYRSASSYVVVVTGVDGLGDVSTTTASITVGQRPQPGVSIAANPATPQAGQPVTFTATITQGTTGATTQSVQWDFGDGTQGTLTGNSTVVVHTYNTPATYVVTAIVTDSTGATGSASTAIVVTPKPTASVLLESIKNPSSISGDAPPKFTATVTQLPSGVTVDHFEWNFGDGATRSTTGNSTNHAYTLPGTYTVTVTAVLSDGSRSSSSIEQRMTP